MTKSEKEILMELLGRELEILKEQDLSNHDLLIAAAAIVELREYLSVRENILGIRGV